MVAGSAVTTGGADFALARYLSDGTLDSSFGSGGKVTNDFSSLMEVANAIALQPDGKIVVAGSPPPNNFYDFALARYNSNGTPDTSFGVGGTVTLLTPAFTEQAFAVAVQADSKILAAGVSLGLGAAPSSFTLARFHGTGAPDQSFGINGVLTTDIGSNSIARAIVLQPDGKIVLAGETRSGFINIAVVRYNSDGSLDSDFGVGGVTTTQIGFGASAFALARQPDGKLVVAGYAAFAGPDSEFAIVRYNSDGSLDQSFGSGGTVVTDILSVSVDVAQAVAFQPDGRLSPSVILIRGQT